MIAPMPSPLSIETFCFGDWMTNCYVAAVGNARWIVDADFAHGAVEKISSLIPSDTRTVADIGYDHGRLMTMPVRQRN